MKVNVSKVYSQGIKGQDMLKEVSQHFGKYNQSNMDATEFYTAAASSC